MENIPRNFDPITGLCIVTDKRSCPLGYRVLEKSYDELVEADLWKDKFLGPKKERYLCYTRNYPLANGTLNNVLESICLINANERDGVPKDFYVVDRPYDSPKEDALKKKLLIVRMVPRFSVPEAVCDLIVLSAKKTAPIGYVKFGELNGFVLCYKKGPVPPSSVKSLSPSPGVHVLQQHDFLNQPRSAPGQPNGDQIRHSSSGEKIKENGNGTIKLKSPSVPTQTGASLARQMSRTLRLSSVPAYTAVDDVPFKLNPALVSVEFTRSPNGPAPPIPYQSREDIERKYFYDFSVERAVELSYGSPG